MKNTIPEMLKLTSSSIKEDILKYVITWDRFQQKMYVFKKDFAMLEKFENPGLHLAVLN